jgi:RNase P subunit RPR2
MTLYCANCHSFGLSVETVIDRPEGGSTKRCNCPNCGETGAYIVDEDGADRLTGCLAREDYHV